MDIAKKTDFRLASEKANSGERLSVN